MTTWRRRRTRERGAVLVEAAVVVPTLALLLGLTMFEYRSYREKMRAQDTSRENAMFFASHGCQGSTDGGGSLWGSVSHAGGGAPADYALDTNGDSSYQDVTDKGPPGGAGSTLSTARSFNKAQTTSKGQASGGHLTRDVSGKSVVYCNERPVDGDPVGVMKWGFTFYRSGLL